MLERAWCKRKDNIKMGIMCNRMIIGFISLGMDQSGARACANKPTVCLKFWKLIY
jgi:hypothetical protein